MVVSNIFYFDPYLGTWSNLTNIFLLGWNHQLVIIKSQANAGICKYTRHGSYGSYGIGKIGQLFSAQTRWRSRLLTDLTTYIGRASRPNVTGKGALYMVGRWCMACLSLKPWHLSLRENQEIEDIEGVLNFDLFASWHVGFEMPLLFLWTVVQVKRGPRNGKLRKQDCDN